MKVTPAQLEYIESLLKRANMRNPILRNEILDHLILGIEEKMAAGSDFDTAFLEIHEAFGNKTTMPWNHIPSVERDYKGYERLYKEKGKHIYKSVHLAIFKNIKDLFLNPRFLILFLLYLIFLVQTFTENKPIIHLIMVCLFSILPFRFSLSSKLFRKSDQYAYILNFSTIGLFLALLCIYWIKEFPNLNWTILLLAYIQLPIGIACYQLSEKYATIYSNKKYSA
ncbi:MAG: hypothetical protein OIF50_11420 [Flavobacteriaceae bacterium]|nr:hypothetical protein [Flavobacteriaceae bacterium]